MPSHRWAWSGGAGRLHHYARSPPIGHGGHLQALPPSHRAPPSLGPACGLAVPRMFGKPLWVSGDAPRNRGGGPTSGIGNLLPSGGESYGGLGTARPEHGRAQIRPNPVDARKERHRSASMLPATETKRSHGISRRRPSACPRDVVGHFPSRLRACSLRESTKFEDCVTQHDDARPSQWLHSCRNSLRLSWRLLRAVADEVNTDDAQLVVGSLQLQGGYPTGHDGLKSNGPELKSKVPPNCKYPASKCAPSAECPESRVRREHGVAFG